MKELNEQQKTHEAALRMIKQRLLNNNTVKSTDKDNKEPQMRGSYRSLRSNPYLNNLPTIYANNDNNAEPLIPNIRSSTYDSTFSAEEIRYLLMIIFV